MSRRQQKLDFSAVGPAMGFPFNRDEFFTMPPC